MGSFVEPSGDVDAVLQSFVLGKLNGRQKASVVPVNALIRDIRSAFPDCELSARRLADLISEASMLLGLIPVINPVFEEGELESEPAFGYGHRAHRPDPQAHFVFSPGKSRTLPIRGARHLRLTK